MWGMGKKSLRLYKDSQKKQSENNIFKNIETAISLQQAKAELPWRLSETNK